MFSGCARWRPDGVRRAIVVAAEQTLDSRVAIHQHERDPDQGYFADGLVEDLITSLSKVAGLFVIAKNSTSPTKARLWTCADRLGVRYVLEGSVRKAANRLRISGQLVEVPSATHVWADKFEGAVEDIFDLQDRLPRHRRRDRAVAATRRDRAGAPQAARQPQRL